MQRRQSFSVLTVASILIIGAVGGVLGGCTRPADGSDSVASATTQETRSESETATTIPAETTSTTAELTEEEAIIAAVNGFRRTFLEANDPPDPNNPKIDLYATGDARARMLERIEIRRSLNQGVRLPSPTLFESHPFLVEAGDDNATVDECMVDDSQLIDLPSGTVIDGSVKTLRFTLTLIKSDGQWKVSTNVLEQEWDGSAGCILNL